MATRGSYVHIKSYRKIFRGHPQNVSFMQFSQNTNGFRQIPSQGF